MIKIIRKKYLESLNNEINLYKDTKEIFVSKFKMGREKINMTRLIMVTFLLCGSEDDVGREVVNCKCTLHVIEGGMFYDASRFVN